MGEIFNWQEGGATKKKIPKKKDDANSAKFRGKYSDASSGQSKYGGWSKEGLARYKVLRELIQQGRHRDDAPANEHFCLDLVKEKHGKLNNANGGGKRNKRKRVAEEEGEEEQLEDIVFDG